MRNYAIDPALRVSGAAAVVRTNLFPYATFASGWTGWGSWAGASGGVATTSTVSSGGYQGGPYLRLTWTTAPSSGGGVYAAAVGATAGKSYMCSAWVRPSATVTFTPQAWAYKDGVSVGGGVGSFPAVTAPAGVWTRVSMRVDVPSDGTVNQIQPRWYVQSGVPSFPVGGTLDFAAPLMEEGQALAPYFDGGMAAANGLTYAWAGTAGASASTASGAPMTHYPAIAAATRWALPSGGARVYCTTGGVSAGVYGEATTTTPGEAWSVTVRVSVPSWATAAADVRVWLRATDAGGALITDTLSPSAPIAPGATADISLAGVVMPAGTTAVRPYIRLYGSAPGTFDIVQAILTKTAQPYPYFDGSSSGARWAGAVNESVSILPTLTATYDAGAVRVGLEGADFSDTEAATVTRNGETVRSADGILPSSGAFFVYDYEMPLAEELAYRAASATIAASAVLTMAEGVDLLRAPGLPALDVRITPAGLPELSFPKPKSVLQPIGAKPVVLSGTRSAGEFTLSVYTLTADEHAGLLELLQTVNTGLLLVPGSVTLERVYVDFGDIKTGRLDPLLDDDPSALTSVECVVTASPPGGIYGDPTASYQAILDTFTTYSAVIAAKPTYLDVLRGV